MRIKRLLVIVVAVIVVVPVGAGALLVATFDPNSYKPELIKAVEKAAGRQVSISGKLHLGLALTPTLSASGITIDNPQGYPDTVMATLERIKAQVALLPLLAHRLDILHLTLVRPQITLERNAAGRGNWVFSKQGAAGSATPAAPSSGTTPAPRRMPQIALKSVSIEHATITYKGVQHPGSPPAITTVSIPHLTGSAPTLASPIAIHAEARYDGVPVAIRGTTGPFARFTGGGGSKPWPVDLLVSVKDAKLALQGTIADPQAMRGADVAMRADIPDLSALDPFAAGMSLPPLNNVTLTAKVTQPNAEQPGAGPSSSGQSTTGQSTTGTAGNGAFALPDITDVKLTAGHAKLGAWRKGLRLSSLDVTMPSLDQKAQINLAGHYQGSPLGLSGQVGPIRPVLEALLGDMQDGAPAQSGQSNGDQSKAPRNGGSRKPDQSTQSGASKRFNVNLSGQISDGTLNVSGGIAKPAQLSGVALKVGMQMPDLGKLSDLLGRPLPALTNLSLSFDLTDPGNQGLAQAVGISSLAATADQFQVGGAGKLTFGKIPDLQAVIRAPRVDLTAIDKAMPAPATPKTSATTSTTQQPSSQPAATSPKKAQPAATPPMLIPATAIPFGLLQRFDANVELTISQLVYGGQTYSGIVSHALLQKGKLTVRPIAAQLPGGSVSGTVTVDSAASPPSIHVTESAPAFHLAPLLALLGHPNGGSGTVQLFADLKGAGNTPRDIAGTLNGKLGIAMVNGEVDGSILRQLLGGTVSAAGLPANVIGAQGPVSVPCFATRLDAKSGTATLRALTLDSSRLFMTGTGQIDLGAERLDLVLNPRVDLGGGRNAPVPVAIRGTLAKPKAGPASPQDYAETAGAIAKQFGGQKAQGLIGEFAQKLGLSRPPPGPQTCAGALTLARMGHSGPQPSNSAMRNTPAPSTATGQSSGGGGSSSGGGSGPQNLLNSLFH